MQSHFRSVLHGVAKSSGGKRGKGDRRQPILLSKVQRVAVTVRQQLFLRPILTVDRSQAVNNVTVRQVVPSGYDGFSRLNGSKGPALFLQAGAGRPVYGAGHSPPVRNQALAAFTTESMSD